MSGKRWAARSGLGNLLLLRWREFIREKSTLFGLFVVPMLIATLSALAMRDDKDARLEVAVLEGPAAQALAAALNDSPGLHATVTSAAGAETLMRQGKIRLEVLPTQPPTLRYDPAPDASRTARLRVMDALERHAGRQDLLRVHDEPVTTPGLRYIDFLVPGLLALSLLMDSMPLCASMIYMRSSKLLKRYMATPMHRRDFMLSYMLSRSAVAVVLTVYYVLGARFLFGVPMRSGMLPMVGFAFLSALALTAMALMMGSRTANVEAAGAITGLTILMLVAFSGVFFSVDRFPGALGTALHFLPLALVSNGLRALMNEGVHSPAVLQAALALGAEGFAFFLAALTFFRWK